LTNDLGQTPLHIVLKRMKLDLQKQEMRWVSPVISCLANANPTAAVALLRRKQLSFDRLRNGSNYRHLLNLVSDDTALLKRLSKDKKALNWWPRSPLVDLVVQIKIAHNVSTMTYALRSRRSSLALAWNGTAFHLLQAAEILTRLLHQMINRSSAVDLRKHPRLFGQGNELGDRLLRKVIFFL